MGKIELGNHINIEQIQSDKNNVENKSNEIEKIVQDVIHKYTIDLDTLVSEIDYKVREQELDGLTDQELESYCLKLSSFMYFSATGQELIGLREAIAGALNKEDYNNKYAEATGTINDKKASAELESQSSMLVELIYDRAEKMMSSKLVYATHLLGSIKRVLNRRIEQMKMNPTTTKFNTTTSIEV